jgi:cytochrome b6-f complex iron-sulfur subunit
LTADPTTSSTATPQPERTRRDMLCGLAVALVAPGALIAACSDSGGGTDSAGGGTDSAGGDQGGGSGGTTALADIPDGGGLIVDNPSGGKALLVRKGQDVTAYDAACTHMGTVVGTPKKGVSTCPNHGSKFDVASGGKVVNGPATKPLKKIDVQVQGDQVTLA